MVIKYPNGKTREGFLLSRQEDSMRVAVENGEDVTEYVQIQGNWISENLEPVEIAFEWQRQPKAEEPPSEADCICPKELAARLIGLLETDSDEEEAPHPRYLTAGQSLM